MNKKGFAISVVLYTVVFLIITIFYLLLGIIKSRYNIGSDLVESITDDLNSPYNIYDKIDTNNAFNTLVVDPNGGSLIVDGNEITEPTNFVRYEGDTLEIETPSRDEPEASNEKYTIDYVTQGGTPVPASQDVFVTIIKQYNFGDWSKEGDCSTLDETTNVYEYPSSYATVCTITAIWNGNQTPSYGQVTLPNNVTRAGFDFSGWKSSTDNEIYAGGASYTVGVNTTMTAQWEPNVYASGIRYNNAKTGMECDTVYCALNELGSILGIE